jgi:hypothetical protein
MISKESRDMASEKHVPKVPAARGPRRPYHKPAFQCERVFETAAVRCGKTDSRIAQCNRVRKTS